MILSTLLWLFMPSLPFMDRVGVVFLACMAIAVVLSLLQKPLQAAMKVELENIDYTTGAGFNIAAPVVAAILVALYATGW